MVESGRLLICCMFIYHTEGSNPSFSVPIFVNIKYNKISSYYKDEPKPTYEP